MRASFDLRHFFLALRPHSAERLYALLFLLYLISLCATHGAIENGIAYVCVVLAVGGILFPRLADVPLFWVAVAIPLVLNLRTSYAESANHYYLTIYTVGYFCVVALHKRARQTMSVNLPRALLVIAFGFAALQKLLSAHFMSGRLLATYFLSGGSLVNSLSFFYDDYDASVQTFRVTMDRVEDNALLGVSSLPVDVPAESFIVLAQVMAVVVVAVELAVFVTLLLNRTFEHPAMPLLMLGFLWGTFVFRPEFSFFGLAALLFLMAKPSMDLRLKALLLLSVVLFTAMEIGDLPVGF